MTNGTMKTILIEVEIPEEYEDIDPQLAAEDFLQRTPGWGWRVLPAQSGSPAPDGSSGRRKGSRQSSQGKV